MTSTCNFFSFLQFPRFLTKSLKGFFEEHGCFWPFWGKKIYPFRKCAFDTSSFSPRWKKQVEKKTSFHQFNHLDSKLAEKNWWKNYIKTRGFLKSVLHERSWEKVKYRRRILVEEFSFIWNSVVEDRMLLIKSIKENAKRKNNL